MVLGVVAYGYIIASVAASLANADSARAQYQEKLKAVKSYMTVRGVMTSLNMCHASVCSCVCVCVCTIYNIMEKEILYEIGV